MKSLGTELLTIKKRDGGGFYRKTRLGASMKSLRLSVVLVLSFLTVICTFSCSKKTPTTGVLKVAIPAGPVSLDSRKATDSYGIMITRLIFDGLFRTDEQMNVVPNLVETFEQDDKTYTFHLKKGVVFHDGTPLTAEDVVYSYGSIMDGSIQSAFKGSFDRVESIEALSSDTVKMTLKEPYAPFLTLLGIGVVPKGYAAEKGEDFSSNPVGTGPYKFVKFVPDSWLVLEANEKYFGDVPRTQTLRFDIIADDNVRVLKLLKGDVDFIQNAVPPMLLAKVAEDKNIKRMEDAGVVVSYLGFNLTDPILADEKVRQAIAYAIDRDAIISHRFQGLAVKANSILSPDNWAYDKNLKGYEYDPQKAKTLLDEAGYKDSDGDGPAMRFGLIYKTSTNKERVDIAQMIAHQLRLVGIDVRVEPYEWGKFYGDIKKGNFQMYSLAWSLLTEPDMFYDVCHSSQWAPDGVNRNRYKNAVVDKLVEEGRVAMSRERRKEVYAKVQEIALAELPYVPLWYEKNVVVYRNNLKGVKLRPDGDLRTLIGVEKK
jgi:peptide/nickel transport system substrate-binding protein